MTSIFEILNSSSAEVSDASAAITRTLPDLLTLLKSAQRSILLDGPRLVSRESLNVAGSRGNLGGPVHRTPAAGATAKSQNTGS